VHYFSFALAYEDVLMCLRFEVLTAVKILMLVWVVMPCGLAGRYQNTIALIMEAVSTSEVLVMFYMVLGLHGKISRKTVFFTAVL
jgi:hypothetical protein